MALKSGQSQMSHGAGWELPVGEMIPVLMGTGDLGNFQGWRTGGVETKLMERQSLEDELLLLAFCQAWDVLWSHGSDFLLGFHSHSEFSALNQEGFKQGGELGCLIHQLRLVAVS